jgi:4a-hydroxytetrahydrobiopterin dehydratase
MRPRALDPSAVDAWLGSHPGWARAGEVALLKRFTTPDFASALALVVRLGMLAEKRDHHPDVLVGWGKVHVTWTTHDAGGVTVLDLELAEATDAIFEGSSGVA